MIHEKLFKLEREAEQRVHEVRDREIDRGGPGSTRRASAAMDAPMLEVAAIRKMRQRLGDLHMEIAHQSNLLRQTGRNPDLPSDVKRYRAGQAEAKLARLEADYKTLETEAEQRFFPAAMTDNSGMVITAAEVKSQQPGVGGRKSRESYPKATGLRPNLATVAIGPAHGISSGGQETPPGPVLQKVAESGDVGDEHTGVPQNVPKMREELEIWKKRHAAEERESAKAAFTDRIEMLEQRIARAMEGRAEMINRYAPNVGPPTAEPVDVTEMYERLRFDPEGLEDNKVAVLRLPSALAAGAIWQIASKSEKELLDSGILTELEWDAYRHAYVSYQVTLSQGAASAKSFGDAHEVGVYNHTQTANGSV